MSLHQTQRSGRSHANTHRKLKSSPQCSSRRRTSGFGWENRENVKEREREGEGRQEEGEKGREITWRAYSLFLWHSHVAPLWEDNLSLLQSQSAIHTITYNINQSVPSNGFWRAAPLYGLQSNPRPLMHLLTLLQQHLANANGSTDAQPSST